MDEEENMYPALQYNKTIRNKLTSEEIKKEKEIQASH